MQGSSWQAKGCRAVLDISHDQGIFNAQTRYLTKVRECGDDHVPLGVDEGLKRAPLPLQPRLQHSLTHSEMMVRSSTCSVPMNSDPS